MLFWYIVIFIYGVEFYIVFFGIWYIQDIDWFIVQDKVVWIVVYNYDVFVVGKFYQVFVQFWSSVGIGRYVWIVGLYQFYVVQIYFFQFIEVWYLFVFFFQVIVYYFGIQYFV